MTIPTAVRMASAVTTVAKWTSHRRTPETVRAAIRVNPCRKIVTIRASSVSGAPI